MIITHYRELLQKYHQLQIADVFVGRIPSRHLKTAFLVDLTDRGVRLIPSATAQLLHTSKTAQTMVLQQWMPPHTRVIERRKDLLTALEDYHRQNIHSVVTKQDHLHCGHGVRKWDNLETLYSCLGLDNSVYPFVLQPFMEDVTDVRMIIVGDFVEAYIRSNPYNFRHNLAAGGQNRPYQFTGEDRGFALQIMTRAGFPYAHMDIMITDQGKLYLTEISLSGGIQGAQIDRKTLDQMKRKHLMRLAQEIVRDRNNT